MNKRLTWTISLLFLVGCSRSNISGQPESTRVSGSASTPVATAIVALSPEPQVIAVAGCKKIAFAMFADPQRQNADIYTICPDGSELKRLTNDPAIDDSPTWSPDGTQIAFASSRSGASQIYVMGADGGAPTQLTFDNFNSWPIWLPGGKQIAFRTTDDKGLWWWRVAQSDGSDVRQLTEPGYDHFFQTSSWSPDGLRSAYMSLEEQKSRNDGSSQIHVKNIDGTNDRALTADIWANMKPVWSPDSSRLAFLSERDGTYDVCALYVVRADGSRLKRLTEPMFSASLTFYSWSSTGEQVVVSDVLRGQISIVDLPTDKATGVLVVRDQLASGVSWQP